MIVAARECDVADRKAHSDLILAIQPSELKQIKGCETANSMWVKLHTVYQLKGPARKAALKKKLTLHKMAEGQDIRDHMREFFEIVAKLQEMEMVINQDQLTIMLVFSLRHSFENF